VVPPRPWAAGGVGGEENESGAKEEENESGAEEES
jgi:hypothetical protein